MLRARWSHNDDQAEQAAKCKSEDVSNGLVWVKGGEGVMSGSKRRAYEVRAMRGRAFSDGVCGMAWHIHSDYPEGEGEGSDTFLRSLAVISSG